MYGSCILLICSSLISLCFAQNTVLASCKAQQYDDLPGFPASKSGCYPTNYYQTSDLGQTDPNNARQQCQQQCTRMGSSCMSVVAQVNKAADSNLYSGTCFFFARGQTVTPRRCADTAYLLEGYTKENSNACFARSTAAASAFCSSYLGISTTTKTVTSTPPVMTVTVTTKATAVPTKRKRATSSNGGTGTSVAAPACVTSGTPSSRLSSACSCLSLTSSTVFTTKTLSQVTTTVTNTVKR